MAKPKQALSTPHDPIHPSRVRPLITQPQQAPGAPFSCFECRDTGEVMGFCPETGHEERPCSCTELSEKDKYYLSVRNV